MSTKILLADDHKMLRDGLRSIVEKEADLEVIAEADNGRTAVELARKLKPDVVVMDIGMPSLNGVEATRQIVSLEPPPKVIALSMHGDRQFVSQMFEAGASGYLLKDCASEVLVAAVRTVMNNQVFLAPGIAGVVIEDYVHRLLRAAAPAELTAREREVLQLLAEGKSTKEIALLLNVAVKTTETHRRNIMEKLKIHSLAELTKYAIRMGLTSLDK